MASAGSSMSSAPYSTSSACHPLRALRCGFLLLLLLLFLLLSLRARAWLDLLHDDDLWRHHKPMQVSKQVYPFEEHEGISHHPPKIKMGVSLSSTLSSPPSISLSTPVTLSASASTRQPGSRPPKCQSSCPGCHGECTARPTYVYGSHSMSQHAVWTCTCVF